MSKFRMSRDGHMLKMSLAAFGLAASANMLWSHAAAAAGPFDPFAGASRGAGEVISRDGARERISCRVSGSVSQGGEALTQSMVCASDNYRFDIRANAAAEGDRVRGEWQETTRGVQGSLAGRIEGGHLSGAVSGAGFTAAFSLRSSGRKIFYILRPSSGDVASVSVVLTR